MSFTSRGEVVRSVVGMPPSRELIVVTETPHFEVRTSIQADVSTGPNTSGTVRLLRMLEPVDCEDDSAFESKGVDFLEFE